MARDTRAAFLAKLDEVQPGLSRAFLEAVQNIRSAAQRRAVEAAIERGDVDGVLTAIRLDDAFWEPLDRQIEEAFRGGALYQTSLLPKRRPGGSAGLFIGFDGRHPRAEAWSRDHVARLVTEISEDTRRVIRETVTEALEASTPPRTVARQLIGTTAGNEVRGGLIGLTSQQAAYVRAMRSELSDPETLSGYFDRARRDRRFDATVRKAMREGRALSEREIETITGRYSERLLRLRGETIARTEALTALNAGRHEAVMQLVESGEVPASAVKLVWQATVGSARTRDTHIGMHGQEVGLGEAFVSPSGARLLFPGDTSQGAPGSETINCRCSVRTRIDYAAMAV